MEHVLGSRKRRSLSPCYLTARKRLHRTVLRYENHRQRTARFGRQPVIGQITEKEALDWIGGVLNGKTKVLSPLNIYFIDGIGNTKTADGVTITVKQPEKPTDPCDVLSDRLRRCNKPDFLSQGTALSPLPQTAARIMFSVKKSAAKLHPPTELPPLRKIPDRPGTRTEFSFGLRF